MGWLDRHVSVGENPGLGQDGYYTYVLSFTRAMRACELAGVDFHDYPRLRDWRNAVTREMMKRQTGAGTWRPGTPGWWENSPALVSTYAMFILANTLL
jgi:hypothetical protein